MLAGDPAAGLRPGLAGPAQRVLAEDSRGDEPAQVLTDGARRRETNFAAVRWNRSSTLTATEPWRLHGPEHTHRYLDDPERWQTTALWTGAVSEVQASSSEAFADALPPLRIGAHPGAALDKDPSTAWRSARQLDPTGQWWQVAFTQPRDLGAVTIRLSPDSAAVPQLRLDSGSDSQVVEAPEPGRSRTYQLGFAGAAELRVTAAGRDLRLPGSFGIAEVRIPGLVAQRFLQLPLPDDRYPLDTISLARDPDRAACVMIRHALPCDDALVAPGEDGDTVARRFTPAYAAEYALSGTVSLRRTTTAGRALLRSKVTATSDGRVADVAEGPIAAVDGDHATTWMAGGSDPKLQVRLPERRRLDSVTVRVNRRIPASTPTRIQVSAGGRTRAVDLDEDGTARLPGWRTDHFTVRVLATAPTFSVAGQRFVDTPAGISSLRVNGRSLNPHAVRARMFGCGSGPVVRVGDEVRRTRLHASTKALLRGESVPFRVCGRGQVAVDARTTDVVATPSPLFRVDSLTLSRTGSASTGVTRAVTVTRDDRGTPTSVTVPDRSTDTLLTLPQNFNEGWTATWHGEELSAQRVDGWKQGWRLPAGSAGAVTLSFAPAGTFTWLLVAGAVLAGLCVLSLVWLWWRDRRGHEEPVAPALRTGRPGLLDASVAVVAGGLLCGWWGLAGVTTAIGLGLALRRFQGWPVLAGLSILVASLALAWAPITDRSWAVTWSQAWSLAADLLHGGRSRVAAQCAPAPRRSGARGDRAHRQGPQAHGFGAGRGLEVHGVVGPDRGHQQHVAAPEQPDPGVLARHAHGCLGVDRRVVPEAQEPADADDRAVEPPAAGARPGVPEAVPVGPGHLAADRVEGDGPEPAPVVHDRRVVGRDGPDAQAVVDGPEHVAVGVGREGERGPQPGRCRQVQQLGARGRPCRLLDVVVVGPGAGRREVAQREPVGADRGQGDEDHARDHRGRRPVDRPGRGDGLRALAGADDGEERQPDRQRQRQRGLGLEPVVQGDLRSRSRSPGWWRPARRSRAAATRGAARPGGPGAGCGRRRRPAPPGPSSRAAARPGPDVPRSGSRRRPAS